jgi:hypothetical protein
MTDIIKDILGLLFGWLKKHDVTDAENAAQCETVANIHAANESEIQQQGQLADPIPETEEPESTPVETVPVEIIEDEPEPTQVVINNILPENTPLLFCECSTARDNDVPGAVVCAIDGKGKAGKYPCLCLHPWYLEGETNTEKSKRLWREINTKWTVTRVAAWGAVSVEEAHEQGFKYLCVDTEGVYCDARWRSFLNPEIYKTCQRLGMKCIHVPKADLSHMIEHLGCGTYQAAADYLEAYSDGVALWSYGSYSAKMFWYADKLREAGYTGQIWLMVRAKEKPGDASEAEKVATLNATLEKPGIGPAVFMPKEDKEGPEIGILRRALS